jgi:hypothetical protein
MTDFGTSVEDSRTRDPRDRDEGPPPHPAAVTAGPGRPTRGRGPIQTTRTLRTALTRRR